MSNKKNSVKLSKKQASEILVIVGNAKDEIHDLLFGNFPEDEKESNWVSKAWLASIVFDAALHCNCESEIEKQEREWDRILSNGVKAKFPTALKCQKICQKMQKDVKAIAAAA